MALGSSCILCFPAFWPHDVHHTLHYTDSLSTPTLPRRPDMYEHSESWRGVGDRTGQKALWVVMVQERDPGALLPCGLIKD